MSLTREAAMRAFEPKSQEFDAPPAEASSAPDGGALDAALRRALREGELRLDFQPLVAVASGATTGFEALLRWRRPGFGELAAGRFVAAAEGSPVFDDVGAWALVEAARAAAAWPSRLRVAVNLSAAQLRSPQIAETVRGLVDRRSNSTRGASNSRSSNPLSSTNSPPSRRLSMRCALTA